MIFSHISFYLSVLLTYVSREEKNKSCELTEMVEVVHQGDVNALKFMSCTSSQTHGGDFLLSASSNGSLYCYRLKDLVGGSPTTICPLETFSIPQWENLFNSSVTCLDVNPLGATVVTASESGDIAWLKLNETLTIERIGT
jgi:WD40 repeat protein